MYFEDGVEPAFPTPSGKIEFYSVQLRDAGFDPVPKFKKPADPPPGLFRLLFGRSPVHSFSRTQSNPILCRRHVGERGVGEPGASRDGSACRPVSTSASRTRTASGAIA